jgi:hypothetical protein
VIVLNPDPPARLLRIAGKSHYSDIEKGTVPVPVFQIPDR